jgi:hypothetical protein
MNNNKFKSTTTGLFVVASMLACFLNRANAQCPSTQNPPGYWGDGMGEVAITCGGGDTVTGCVMFYLSVYLALSS